MAKQPAKPAKAERPDEYEIFERGLRKVLSVPKRDVDKALDREREQRANGNGSK